MPIISLSFNLSKSTLALILYLLVATTGWGQVLFSENFGTSTGATYDVSGAIGTSTDWSVSRSGVDFGSRIDAGLLDLTNDATVTTNSSGWIFGYRDMNSLLGWNTTLSSNTGTISWEFNMRQIRTDPAGFASGSYGVAFILACTNTTAATTGSGYAVILGQSGNSDPIRLAAFNNGLQGTLTDILTSNTTGLNDFGVEYLSICVKYIPGSNTWELFLRNDGTTSFVDPTSGIALTSQGTAVNSIYTSTTGMRYIGGYWQGSNAANQTAFFDNIYLKILSPPSLTTPTVSNIATTSATLGATVTSDGGATLTARGTVWGTAASPTGNAAAEGGTTVAAFTHSRTGLTANTVYTYRGYATNSAGTGYSADGTFTTLPLAPTIGTASSATTTGFTANWSHPTMGAASYSYTVEVDDNSDFSSITTTVTSISSSNTSQVITGLASSTTYYYRIKAVNAQGSSAWSSTSAGVTTLSNTSPILTAGTISNSFGTVCVNSTSNAQSFTLSGSNLNGTDVTISSTSSTYTFATSSGGSYSNPLTLTAYDGSSPSSIFVKFAPTAIGVDNADISISGGGATSVTVTQSGNSGVNTIPTIINPTTASLSTTTITLGGTISTLGCSNATSTGIYYSTTNGFGNGSGTAVSTGSLNLSSTPAVFTQVVSGLSANTQYYFKAYATNSGGNGYSVQSSFITFPTSPSSLSSGTPNTNSTTISWADVSGTLESYEVQIFSDAYVTQVGSTYTTGLNSTSQSITGLSSGTTYYFRVRAVNNTNQYSSWTNGGTFLTLSPPCTTSSQGGWDFTTSSSVSTAISNLTISSLSQGNNNGTTTLISITSASNYSGATGTGNAGAAAYSGAFNISSSTYFEFTITPASGYNFTLTGISFGSRSTSTGPQAYSLRSSIDNYSSDIATGTLSANGVWALFTNSGLNLTGSNAVTFRLFGHSGTGSASANTANWRIDDLTLSVDMIITPGASSPTASAQSFCSSASPTIADLVATGTGIQWYAASTGGSVLSTSTALQNATNYFASQTANGCESNRTSVAVTLNPNGTWKGSSSGNWDVAANWCGGVPSSSSSVVIAAGNSVSLDVSPTTVANLTIAGSLSVPSNSQLTVTGTLTNNGTLTLQNGATFKQGSNVAGGGTYNIQQNLDNCSNNGTSLTGRYWYLGSPVTSLRENSFGNAGDLNKVWSFTNGAYSAIQNGQTLTPTTGYVHRRGTNASPLTFTGTSLYATDVTLSLSNNAGTYGGWHLIANPYTAYLDWQQVYNASYALSTAISPSYYIRSFNTSGNDVNALITYNSSTGLESNTSSYSLGSTGSTTAQHIAPMQAFWVKINPTTPLSATAGQLRLERAFTSHQTGNVGLKNSTVFPTLARVNLVDGARFDQMLVFMNQDMSNAVDQYDSEKMFVSGAPQIYTMAAGKKLVMNGLKNNKKKISVPLYLELPESKVYNLQLAEYILEDGLILLEDKQEGIIQDFTINDVYAFYANSGVLSNRFVLHFFAPDNGITAQGPSNSWVQDENEVNEGGSILVSSNGRGKVTIQQDIDPQAADGSQVIIRDASGRMVYEGQLEGTQTSLQLDAPSGVYFVEVQLNGQVEVKKIFVQQ